MFLKSRQVASANDVARSDNPNPQFVIIFVHWLCAISILQTRLALVRAKFDRLRQLGVQPWIFRAEEYKARRINIHLTGWLVRATLRGVFHSCYVENLQYYGIKSHARQRHSPARPG
jgi:hypothetical protein